MSDQEPQNEAAQEGGADSVANIDTWRDVQKNSIYAVLRIRKDGTISYCFDRDADASYTETRKAIIRKVYKHNKPILLRKKGHLDGRLKEHNKKLKRLEYKISKNREQIDMANVYVYK